MKINFKFLLIAAAALAFAACDPVDGPEPEKPDEPIENPTPNPEPDPEEGLNQDLMFTLELNNIESDQAVVSVTNNGTDADTWHYFYTEDMTSSESSLITAEVKALIAEGKISGLKNATSTQVTLLNLNPNTEYRFIVLGLSEEGEFYGTPASISFTTLKKEIEFKENPAWTVEYMGAGNINGTVYEHTVTVTSTDKNLYFLTGVSTTDLEKLGIKAIAEDNLAFLKEYIASFNKAEGTNYTLNDILFQGTGTDALSLEAGTDWIALAIGVGTDGELSGLYAQSEVIRIVEEEPTEAYSSWIGNWIMTGSNGITQAVTFSKGLSNKTYKMTGYEGKDASDLEVIVEWNPEDELWCIYNQNIGTFNFGTAGDGDIWFVGMSEDGNLYLSNIPICIGGVFEDGTRGAIGYEEEWEENGQTNSFYVNNMAFIAELSNGLSWITGTFQSGFPSFPITMTPNNSISGLSVEEPESVQIVTGLVRPHKTFGSIR